MTDSRFECIVLGVGGIGSAALYYLARKGVRALGIDRFEPGHDRGSSHGDTRIIRLAYFEHPDYVPLLKKSYLLWSELEETHRNQLLFKSGLLQTGPANGDVIKGIRRSAKLHSLEIEEVDKSDLNDRFPGFQIPDSHSVIFEKDAGFLLVEESIKAFTANAVNLGAQLAVGDSIVSWNQNDRLFSVLTEKNEYVSERLIVSPGAWVPAILPEVDVPFSIVRKPLLWYRTKSQDYSLENGAPAFLIEDGSGIFYGFPQTGGNEMKLAEHTGGTVIDDPFLPDRRLLETDRSSVECFIGSYLPGVTKNCLRHTVCMYTRSPDDHFVIDAIPGTLNGYFAAGLSGHGYKFAAVLGKALADLVVDGKSKEDLDFLRLSRFGKC